MIITNHCTSTYVHYNKMSSTLVNRYFLDRRAHILHIIINVTPITYNLADLRSNIQDIPVTTYEGMQYIPIILNTINTSVKTLPCYNLSVNVYVIGQQFVLYLYISYEHTHVKYCNNNTIYYRYRVHHNVDNVATVSLYI